MFIWLCLIAVIAHDSSDAKTSTSDRPIIGVLAQRKFSTPKSYYVAATYVQFLKQTGAGVVAIKMNMNESYYENLFSSLNGLLIPGGKTSLYTSPYAKVGKFFYDKAIEANNRGDYFPIWGTCLGFELLSFLTAGTPTLRNCSANNVNFNLTFTQDAQKSRLYSSIDADLLTYVSENDATQNNHHFCMSSEFFNANARLRNFYDILSVNEDVNGVEFISSIEAKKYPFYGVQYHPEKNAFQVNSNISVPNKPKDIEFAFQIARFITEEAKKSNHIFSSLEEEAGHLTDNYCPLYSGAPHFTQDYMFV